MSILLFDTPHSFKHSANILIPLEHTFTCNITASDAKFQICTHKKTDADHCHKHVHSRVVCVRCATKVAYVKFLTFSIAFHYTSLHVLMHVLKFAAPSVISFFFSSLLCRCCKSCNIVGASKVIITVLYHFVKPPEAVEVAQRYKWNLCMYICDALQQKP